MDATRFDRIAKGFADRKLSRRQAVVQGGVPAATGPAAAAAQDAAPDPTMLFVQTYQAGTIAPVEGSAGRYTLTLEAGSGQTVYFSDRPDRVVGANPTSAFLEGLGFPDDNPPNAALVVETAPGEIDVAVVELFAPVYDPVGQGVTYEVEVLANWQSSLELGFTEAPTDLAALAPSFGSAHLFIDDCPNLTISCYQYPSGERVGQFDDQGMCWNYSLCIPCEPYGHVQPDRCATKIHWEQKCNESFPACNNGCSIDNNWAFYGTMCPRWSR